MTEKSQIARRGTPRYELAQDLPGRTESIVPVQVVDLSTSGALIEYHRYLRAGAELALELSLSKGQQKVTCSVVHCAVHEIQRHPGRAERTVFRMGVKFEDLAPSCRREIQSMILERLNNERREQPRLYIGLPARVEETIELRTLNIGPQGGLFAMGYPLDPGTEYDFLFRLPRGEVKARGLVRHCQPWSQADTKTRFQVGVEFKVFESDGEAMVRQYLEELDGSGT